jgi:hypothetical protein
MCHSLVSCRNAEAQLEDPPENIALQGNSSASTYTAFHVATIESSALQSRARTRVSFPGSWNLG